MKTTRFDGSDVRKVITGMITDSVVCGRVASQWPNGGEGLFGANWANLIAGLVIRFYREYRQPPNRQIVSIYEEWAKTTTAPDEEVETIERLLRAIADESHQETSEYLIDLAGEHFNKVRLERLQHQIAMDLETGDVKAAQDRIETSLRINLGAGSYSELAHPDAADLWLQAFDTDTVRPVFRYRGALGDFVGDAFQKGRLFSFMAPDKTGKTAFLIDAAVRVIQNHQYVAFFDSGDSIQADFIRRLACRVSGHPLRDTECSVPLCWDGEELQSKKEFRDAVDPMLAFQKMAAWACNQHALRTSFHPSGSLSASLIDECLERWSREDDWRPDAVIVDYADILAPPKGFKETVDQIDETWKILRRISQQRHTLVLTATQSNAESYRRGSDLLRKKHFSGRKTKFAHVNGMLGINVTDEEKDNDSCRLNWLVRREAAYNESRCVHVAGCLSVGAPIVISRKQTDRQADVAAVATEPGVAG